MNPYEPNGIIMMHCGSSNRCIVQQEIFISNERLSLGPLAAAAKPVPMALSPPDVMSSPASIIATAPLNLLDHAGSSRVGSEAAFARICWNLVTYAHTRAALMTVQGGFACCWFAAYAVEDNNYPTARQTTPLSS